MRVFVFESLSGTPARAIDPALLGAGIAMRDAVVRDLLDSGAEVTVASAAHALVTPPPETPGPRRAEVLHTLPGETAADIVARQSPLHDRTWVIAPETNDLLGRLRQCVTAARWIGCEARAIEVATSKRATVARAAAQGLLTPLAFAPGRGGGPRRWVVKPDDGAGSLCARIHGTLSFARDDLTERTGQAENAVLEPWVEGEALSLSLLCRRGDAELLTVNRQMLHVDRAGRLVFDGVDTNAIALSDPRGLLLDGWAQRVVKAFPGLHGYVGVDLVWHARRGPVLIEVNPRVTMAYVGLSAVLGRNLADAVLALDAVPERAGD